MELCYLETKWIILGNRTSNLNRWTTNWNISRDCNGIQKQVSWSHTFKLAWWSCKYLHINPISFRDPNVIQTQLFNLESMHQSACISSSQYRHFEECEEWVNCTLGVINMFTRNKITIPSRCKAFITKWTWQKEKFRSKNWRTMIINQKPWMAKTMVWLLNVGSHFSYTRPGHKL